MKILAIVSFLFSLCGSAWAYDSTPKVYQYHITADGNYPSAAGEDVGTRNFSACSVSTTYTTGTGDLAVKVKNTGGTFTTLSGGPITGSDFKYFATPFTHFVLNFSSCAASCDVYATVKCGMQ